MLVVDFVGQAVAVQGQKGAGAEVPEEPPSDPFEDEGMLDLGSEEELLSVGADPNVAAELVRLSKSNLSVEAGRYGAIIRRAGKVATAPFARPPQRSTEVYALDEDESNSGIGEEVAARAVFRPPAADDKAP